MVLSSPVNSNSAMAQGLSRKAGGLKLDMPTQCVGRRHLTFYSHPGFFPFLLTWAESQIFLTKDQTKTSWLPKSDRH